MKYVDRTIDGIGDLLVCLSEKTQVSEPVWFRGHADTSWKLDCTLARSGGMEKELPLIRRFKS